MAAWTLPVMIAEWFEIRTSVLDRRSRKYFFTIILGMLLGCGRRTVSCWLRAAGVSDDSPTKRCGPKMQLAAELVELCVTLFKNWFRKRVMVVACEAYAKRPFLKRVKATGAVVVRVTVLDDQIIRGVGFLQIRADVQNAVSFCVLWERRVLYPQFHRF